jgi:hypothetical protein
MKGPYQAIKLNLPFYLFASAPVWASRRWDLPESRMVNCEFRLLGVCGSIARSNQKISNRNGVREQAKIKQISR